MLEKLVWLQFKARFQLYSELCLSVSPLLNETTTLFCTSTLRLYTICSLNQMGRCISIHHFLPRAGREVVPVVPCELVLKIPDFVDLNPCVTVGEIEFLKNCQHASQMAKREQSL